MPAFFQVKPLMLVCRNKRSWSMRMSWKIRLNILNHNCWLFYSLKLTSEATMLLPSLMYSPTRPKSHITMPQWVWQTSSAPPRKPQGESQRSPPSGQTDRHPTDIWTIRLINITMYTNLSHLWPWTCKSTVFIILRKIQAKQKKIDNWKKNLPFLHITPFSGFWTDLWVLTSPVHC